MSCVARAGRRSVSPTPERMAAWGRISDQGVAARRIRGIGARIGDQLDLPSPEAAISSLPLVVIFIRLSPALCSGDFGTRRKLRVLR